MGRRIASPNRHCRLSSPQHGTAVLFRSANGCCGTAFRCRNVTLLAGDGGVGKTILHLQAGTAIVLGRQWLGIPTEPGPVAVVCCEDDADELHRRVALIADHYQVELSDLGMSTR